MLTLYRVLFYTLILCLLLTVPLSANSLWSNQVGNVYKSRIAREIGDIVTIVIVEKSMASQKATTETAQSTTMGAGPGLGIFDFVKTFTLNYDDKNGADATTTRQGLLNAQIAAQVIDKQPNGNLVVRGTKSIKINGENQEIEIIGVIRPDDIGADNMVQSVYMTDVEIRYVGQGVVGDKQRASLFEKLFNWLF